MNTKLSVSFLALTVVLISASPIGNIALAADLSAEEGNVFEEIYVTARKRKETLQAVPAAVTAIGGQYIKDANLTRISDFIDIVPNALVSPGSFTLNDAILLRGVDGQLDFIEPGTGLYRDGFYIGGSRTTFSDFMDLERVEVLRGPQGALYGRNAVGGAVNFVYHQPDLEQASGRVEVGYGSHERFEGRATLNAPVVEGRLAVRANLWYIDQNKGEYFNVTRGEYQDKQDSKGIRVAAKLQVKENIDVVWTVERSDETGPENYGAAEEDGETKKTVRRDTESELEQKWWFLSQAVNWDLGDAGTVTALFSHRVYDMDAIGDQDGFDQADIQQSVIRRNEGLKSNYGELRWTSPDSWRLKWLIGANYFDEDFGLVRPVDLNFGDGTTVQASNTDVSIDTKSYAVFADATLTIIDGLEANASIRYTDDTKDFDFLRTVSTNGVAAAPLMLVQSRSFENTSLGGGISWRPVDDVNLYFRANEGFRAGGYNTGFSGAVTDPEVLPYNPETSLNLEVGAKTAWLDNRFIFNIAAFRMKQKDLLQGVFISPNFFQKNVGTSVTKGIEIDLTARPIENLEIIGTYGYITGKITEINTPDVGGTVYTAADSPVSGANTDNFYIGATYTVPMSNGMSIVLNGSWKYQHNRDPFAAFTLGDVALQDYSIVNTTIGLEAERWSVSVYGNNLTDDDYVIGQAFFAPLGPLRPINTRAPGRTFGVKATAKF